MMRVLHRVSLALVVMAACDASGGAPSGDATATHDDATDAATDPGDTQASTPPDTAATTEPTTGDTTSADAEVVAPPATHELALGGWTLSPAEETTRCVMLRLDNPAPVRVNRIRTNLGRGSHHMIVYLSDATQERTEPYECSPFTETLGGQTVPLVISQVREDVVELPDGVAYELAAHQMIRLEAHHLNYFPEPIEADVKVWFDTVPATEPTEKADILFYGTLAVYVPQGETVTNPWRHLDVPMGLKVFSMTGHTHALGTNVEVERTASADVAGTPVYPPAGEPFAWDEAPVSHFEPPLEFNAPGDGFRFRCSWVNTTDHDVGFGESATAEMCFFWAYYWPSQGPIIRF